MSIFLSERGFMLKYFPLERLKETYGNDELQDFDAIEIFDEEIIKTQTFIDGKYTSGKRIKVQILNYNNPVVDAKAVKKIHLESLDWDGSL